MNRFQELLEQDAIFPHVLAASTWDGQGLRTNQYVSPALSNDYGCDAVMIQRVEAVQTGLAYRDPDQKGLREFCERAVVKIPRGNCGNAMFSMHFIQGGYLTIVADDLVRPIDLVKAGRRIQQQL